MTQLRIRERFTYTPAQIKTNGVESTISILKMACLVFAFCAATTIGSHAQTFTSLASFDGTNGANPEWGALAQGLDGSLYGTTSGGGLSNGGCFRSTDGNCGVVFKISPAPEHTMSTVYEFTDGKDGSGPMPGLVLDTNGNFYGVNSNGGNLGVCFGIGCGSVFKISPGGRFTALHQFDFAETANSVSTLVQVTNGNLYGAGVNGGSFNDCPNGDGCGSIFEITPEGALTTLHNFDFNDGWNPQNVAMVQAADFALYGETTQGGNSSACDNGCGTLFKMTLEGGFTSLRHFAGTDGENPTGGLVDASDGNFYGTTFNGGAHGMGTVFKITPSGTFTLLHSFDGTDGANPDGGVIQATNGNFYGTTSAGGSHGDGTIFEMSPEGGIHTLHDFDGADGSDASNTLLQDTNGVLYGTTFAGGSSNDGTVFSLTIGQGRFVKTLPTRGKVGRKVIILGNDLRGTTSVTFNGAAAEFTIVRGSEIEATVPSGAGTGKVEVTTPTGVLKSNVPFLLTP